MALVLAGLAAAACSGKKAPSRGASKSVAPVRSPAADPPPGLPKRLFARKFVARVRSRPAVDAPQLGYLRAGTVVAAKGAAPAGFERCRRGWYELAHPGGFVCDGREVTAFSGDALPDRPRTLADRSAALPYRYAFNRSPDTPMYKRLPTEEEALYWEDGISPASDAGVLEPPDAADAGSTPAPARGPVTLSDLQGERGGVLRRRLNRGFHVSIDREFSTPMRPYYRTMSDGYIPRSRMVFVDGSSFRGVELRSEGAPVLPFAFVTENEAQLVRTGPSARTVRAGAMRRYSVTAVGPERVVRGHAYWELPTGLLIRARDVTRLQVRPRPPDVDPSERWIDVDLGTQALVAYEGDVPVFATLVSTGRIRSERNPALNHATPTGLFRILSKHVSATMDGDHAVFGAYSLEDVPYVQFFRGAFAMHGAFWHDRFGRPASHGCINLAPRDALWLFNWTLPDVPKDWHAAYPTAAQRGTWLLIRGETPPG